MTCALEKHLYSAVIESCVLKMSIGSGNGCCHLDLLNLHNFGPSLTVKISNYDCGFIYFFLNFSVFALCILKLYYYVYIHLYLLYLPDVLTLFIIMESASLSLGILLTKTLFLS